MNDSVTTSPRVPSGTGAIGVLGGTFNPVHIGHLRGALDARSLLGLTAVRLVPAAMPPLKTQPSVPAEHRLAMLQRAVADVDGLEVDGRELAREGPSYTVDTLLSLRAECGQTPLVFLMGADALAGLQRWSRWEQLLELANIAVLRRPGARGNPPPGLEDWWSRHVTESSLLAAQPAGAVAWLDQHPIDVSSTRVRSLLAAGESVRFLLPDAVIEYIHAHDLYRTPD